MNSERTDFMPGAMPVNEYKAERTYSQESGIQVWSDRGKLFVRIPMPGDHPLQVEINASDKTFDAYGHD